MCASISVQGHMVFQPRCGPSLVLTLIFNLTRRSVSGMAVWIQINLPHIALMKLSTGGRLSASTTSCTPFVSVMPTDSRMAGASNILTYLI